MNRFFLFFTILILLTFTSIANAQEETFCTLQYDPVCGRVDTGIRCITEPCDSFEDVTFGNMCALNAAGAEYISYGECNESVKEEVAESSTDVDEIDEGMTIIENGNIILPPWERASFSKEKNFKKNKKENKKKESIWDLFFLGIRGNLFFIK